MLGDDLIECLKTGVDLVYQLCRTQTFGNECEIFKIREHHRYIIEQTRIGTSFGFQPPLLLQAKYSRVIRHFSAFPD